MSIRNILNSGFVRQSNRSLNINPVSTSIHPHTSDISIFPVDETINTSNFIYDGKSVLMINNIPNNPSNQTKGQYFGTKRNSFITSTGENTFNTFDFDSNNISNGGVAHQDILSDSGRYINLNADSGNNSIFNYDILNSQNLINSINLDGSLPMIYFALTNIPYTTYSTNIPVAPLPDSTNCTVDYDLVGSSNFIIRANYYFPIVHSILIIKIVFTIKNTESLSYTASPSSGTPTLIVQVFNKVVPRDFMTNGITNNNTKVMEYGPVTFSLKYNTSPGGGFDPTNASHGDNYNIPIVFAPGFTPIFCNLPVVYVPVVDSGITPNRYRLQCVNNDTITIGTDSTIHINTSNIGQETIDSPNSSSSYGHFVVGFGYPTNFNSYLNTVNVYTNNTLKNIWRSPLSIYNSSRIFSEMDMVNKHVVVLFGQTTSGATFVVVNSGTPIDQITSFATTPLNNFMNIMNAVIQNYNISYTLADYFVNKSLITTLNQIYNLSITPLNLQSLIGGSITTPNCSEKSYYFLLNSINSAKFTIDIADQNVFNQDIGENYFGLTNSTLVSIGNCTYGNKNLNSLPTLTIPTGIFGNAIYLGLNQINDTRYYVLLILPETLFNICKINSHTINIYPSVDSLFYITHDNTYSQYDVNSLINKYVLSVSRTPIVL